MVSLYPPVSLPLVATFSFLERRTFGTSEFLSGTSRPAGLKEFYEGFQGGWRSHLDCILQFSVLDHSSLTVAVKPCPWEHQNFHWPFRVSQINLHWEHHLKKFCLFHKTRYTERKEEAFEDQRIDEHTPLIHPDILQEGKQPRRHKSIWASAQGRSLFPTLGPDSAHEVRVMYKGQAVGNLLGGNKDLD